MFTARGTVVFPPYQGTRGALPHCWLPSPRIPPWLISGASAKLLTTPTNFIATSCMTSSPHHADVIRKKAPKARQTNFCQKPVKVSFSFISIGCFHETGAWKLHRSCYQSSSPPPDQHNPASHSTIRRPNLQITPVRVQKHRYLPISPPKTVFF